jgi:hypothetical protein
MKRDEWVLVIRPHPRWRDPVYWAEIRARIAKDEEPQQFKSQPAKKGTT